VDDLEVPPEDSTEDGKTDEPREEDR
jgi:hypothetical protein